MQDPRRCHGELERATLAHNIESMKEDLCKERERCAMLCQRNNALRTDVQRR